MNLLLNIIIASCLFFNSNSDDLSINYQYPRNIDALILACDEMYSYNNNHFVDKLRYGIYPFHRYNIRRTTKSN